MAVINYFDDVLEEATKSEEVIDKVSIKSLVEKYINEKGDDSQLIEVYHADTDTTEYQKVEPDTYKILALVDGQEQPLDYVIEADVIVSVIFIPQSSKGALIAGGIALSAIAIALGLGGFALIARCFAGPISIATANKLMAIGFATMATGFVTGLGAASLFNKASNLGSSSDSDKEQESLPYLSGAENENIIGNRYPFTLGKHLLSPYIVGTPYHETKILGYGNAFDGGQIYHALYCAGYGPLKLTNFKFGENILAYNQSSAAATRQTVLHGMLTGTGTDKDDGDIAIKFKNNDIKLEILQAGDKAYDIKNNMYAWTRTAFLSKYTKYTYTDTPAVGDCIYNINGNEYAVITAVTSTAIKAGLYTYTRNSAKDFSLVDKDDIYGTIYPQACLEKEIKANCLFIFDKDIEETQKTNPASVLYYNKSIPIGFRNNTVRMSSSCPIELEVELDFSNGLYATNQTRSSSKSDYKTKYYDIPMNIAVQWRFTGPNTTSSNAESPVGWNTFDCMYFAAGDYTDRETGVTTHYNEMKIAPQAYTGTDRSVEISTNKGLSDDTTSTQNPNWIGAEVFKLTPYTTTSVRCNLDEVTAALNAGYITSYTETSTYATKKATKTYPYVSKDFEKITKTNYTVTDTGKAAGYTIQYSDGAYVPFMKKSISLTTGHDADDFNIDERRYVFKKTFTEDECRQLVGYTGNENILDLVEVRVIRITPCFINQSGVSADTYTDMTYQDLFTWSYLRTKTFDKTKYLKALNASETTGDDVSVYDYPERPEPIDEDLNRFVYIALQAKEDSTGTMGGSLSKLNCITESFTPKYSEDDEKWYPENIWEENNYWHKTDDGNVKITQQEYEENVVNDQDHYVKQRKGNDFTTQIRDEIFVWDNLEKDSSGNPTVNPIMKYTIPDEVARKYITSNSAAQMAHAITGSFLSNDAKTYDCIQMDKLTEFYQFCEDITDETAESYVGLSSNLVSTIDNCNPSRLHTKSEFRTAAYKETHSLYSTDGSTFYWDETKTEKVLTSDIVSATRQGTTYWYTCVMLYQGDYGTDFAQVWSNTDGTSAVVVTGVKNSGMYTASQLSTLQSEWEKGSLSDTSVIMATFSGSNSIQRAEYYAQVYHMVIAAYFESYALYNVKTDIKDWFAAKSISVTDDGYLQKANRIFEKLRNWPINALRNDIHSDSIKALNECICKHDGVDVDPIYESYILDVLEQTMQTGQADKLVADSDDELHVKFECNGVITKEVKLETLIQKILLTGRSYLKRSDENKYEPLMGKPNPYPVTVLNQRNCISKSNTKSYDELPCGYQVSCIDEDDNYNTNDFYVMNKGEDYTDPTAKIEQYQLDYVTNKWQLACLARFNLATRLYQLESYTRTVGMLGFSVSLGDTVLLQDDSLLIGTDRAGRIMELLQDEDYIYGFTTDEPFQYTGELDSESGLCVQGCTVIQPSQYQASRCVTLRCATPTQEVTVYGTTYKMTVGLTNLFLLSLAINKSSHQPDDMADAKEINEVDSEDLLFMPKIDNVVAFGHVSSIYTKAVVMQIKPSEKGQFTLTLSPYNENLYRSGLGVPVFKSNMTISPVSDNYELSDNVTTAQLQEKSIQIAEQISPDVNNLSLISENGYTFVPNSNESGYTPTKITLDVVVTGGLSIDDCIWYLNDEQIAAGVSSYDFTPDTTGIVKCVCGDYFDTVTIAKISGSNSISIICNNETFTVPINSDLQFTSSGDVKVQFEVYKGVKKLTAVQSDPGDGEFCISEPSVTGITIEKGLAYLDFQYKSGDQLGDVQNVINIDVTIGGVGTLTKTLIMLGVTSGSEGVSPYLVVANDNIIIPVNSSKSTTETVSIDVDYNVYRGTTKLLSTLESEVTKGYFSIVKPDIKIGVCSISQKDEYTLTLNYIVGKNVDCSQISKIKVTVKAEN